MCLVISDKDTKFVLRKFEEAKKNGQNYIICYKALNYYSDNTNKLYSPYRYTKYNNGWNESSRFNTKILDAERKTEAIDLGIHVFTTLKEARKEFCKDQIIPVRCYKSNFVSGGIGREAVFTKVFLLKKDVEKFIKNYDKNRDVPF
jgi:hypothetical protein